MDNAAFLVPFLISLNIYDFISDINLSITIFSHTDLEYDASNMILLLAIGSVFFIVLPYFSNLWYAMRINKQEAIQNCPSARAWFANI